MMTGHLMSHVHHCEAGVVTVKQVLLLHSLRVLLEIAVQQRYYCHQLVAHGNEIY
jgi:hypothetical protein